MSIHSKQTVKSLRHSKQYNSISYIMLNDIADLG